MSDSIENSRSFKSKWQQIVNESEAFETYNEAKAIYWQEFDSGFAFLRPCYRMLEEILKRNRWLVPGTSSYMRVLNLCGAPGGFCKALLEKNENIFIDLFTLPEEQGGHKMLFHPPNVNVNPLGESLGDVVELARAISRSDDEQCSRFWHFNAYELVILDGKVFGAPKRRLYQGMNDFSEKDQKEKREDDEDEKEQITLKNLELKLSELYIGLRSISSNGSLITRMKMKTGRQTNALLLLLSSAFQHIKVEKLGRQFCFGMWSDSFCYLVCSNPVDDQSIVCDEILQLLAFVRNSHVELIDEILDNHPQIQNALQLMEEFFHKSTNLFTKELDSISQETKKFSSPNTNPKNGENLCQKCGYSPFSRVHLSRCPAREHKCRQCTKWGHFEEFCTTSFTPF